MPDNDKHSLDSRGLPPDYQFQDEWEITPRDARDELRGPHAPILLDVRMPDELDTASVEGAVAIPLPELPTRLDELEHARDKRIITMCHRGRRSLRAASILRNAGFTDVVSMAGGIHLWSVDVDPTVAQY